MSESVEVAYSTPDFFLHVYAMLFESGLHASCSTPPNGFMGHSYGSSARMSVPSVMPSAVTSAKKGWGIVSTYSSQWR